VQLLDAVDSFHDADLVDFHSSEHIDRQIQLKIVHPEWKGGVSAELDESSEFRITLKDVQIGNVSGDLNDITKHSIMGLTIEGDSLSINTGFCSVEIEFNLEESVIEISTEFELALGYLSKIFVG